MRVYYKSLKRSVDFTVVVRKNPFKLKFMHVVDKTRELEREVLGYANMGFNLGDIPKKLEELKIIVDYANVSINNNEVFGMKSNVIYAEDLVEEIERDMFFLRFQKMLVSRRFHFIIVLLAIAAGVAIVKLLIIPWKNIREELKSYMDVERSIIEKRRDIERQYFKRIIDEETFKRMMFQDQDELYNIREKVREIKRRERRLILRAAVLPALILFVYDILRKRRK